MSVELAPRTGLIGKPLPNGLILPADLSYDEWASVVQHAEMIVEASPWWLSDALAWGEAHFGERSSQIFPTAEEDPNGYRQSRLKQAAWMAAKYPRNQRVPGLSYTHHRVVAEMEPEDRAELLQAAVSEGLSTRDLIARVKQRQADRQALDAQAAPVCPAEGEAGAWMPTPDQLTEEAAARMRFEMAMRGARSAADFGAGWCAALAFVEALDCFRRD